MIKNLFKHRGRDKVKYGLASSKEKELDPMSALQSLMNRRQTDSSISSNLTSMKDRMAGGLINNGGLRRRRYEPFTRIPVSAAFIEVKIQEIEQRLRESEEPYAQPQNMMQAANETDKESFGATISGPTFNIKQNSTLMKIKESLHRKSGILNKIKPGQRPEAELAVDYPTEELSLIHFQLAK